MPYKIKISDKAYRNLANIPKKDGNRIVRRIYKLADDPRPPWSKKMKGSLEGNWRIRVGSYRVIYRIMDNELIVSVIKIAHRKDIYQRI